ncbi:MAG: phosphoribosyltransferase family protein [Patescibacteria group bacterium]|jgi:hypothetical protein
METSPKKFVIKEKYSWEEFERDVKILADKVKMDYLPDAVVAIAEGGWVPGRIIKKYIKADYFSIGCRHHDENYGEMEEVQVYQEIDKKNIFGKKILVIDEICDSGKTLKKVSEILKAMGPQEVRSAVIHVRHSSAFAPDYFLEKKSNDNYIVYPWE